jgi:UDP-N-acetylmuramate dehydrogenase
MAYIRNNYPIGPLTWLKVGGTVNTLFIPKNIQEIQDFLKNHSTQDVMVLGAISNSLILDGHWDKIVLKTTGLNQIQLLEDGVSIRAQCGVLDKTLAHFALQHSIGGLEFLDSIPGTVGGNIFTNAGCYGSEIKDVVTELEIIDRQGVIQTVSPDIFQFSYRHSIIPDHVFMIYSVTFKGLADDATNIAAKMQTMANQRMASQPIGIATCGSTFKNPLPHKAWQLIAASGAHQLKIGGAQWSQLHCNFLHNTGHKADDIHELCRQTQKMVKEKCNVDLELEIFIFGQHKS